MIRMRRYGVKASSDNLLDKFKPQFVGAPVTAPPISISNLENPIF